MKFKLFTKQNILSVAVSLALFGAVPVVLAWAPPTSTNPNDNSPAPLNVGGGYDIKNGKLGLFSSDTFLRISRDNSYVPSSSNQLSSLLLGVNGKAGAKQYCDEWGNHCKTIQELKAALGL